MATYSDRYKDKNDDAIFDQDWDRDRRSKDMTAILSTIFNAYLSVLQSFFGWILTYNNRWFQQKQRNLSLEAVFSFWLSINL